MGGIPRTRTGLVPTSYRQKVEELSFPWSPLPTKPKPQMYRYRGDYVNERNKNLLIKRKLALKQEQSSFERSSSYENESLGSILKITPYSSINADVKLSSKLATHSTKIENWDPYYKHASLHKLSEGEETARARNRSKFVSYLRVEASKRLERKGDTTDNEEHRLNCAAVIVRQRKPPVPRLSHLARSREFKGNKESHPNDQQKQIRRTESKPVIFQGSLSRESKHMNEKKTKLKAGYLDFISKKSYYPQEQPLVRVEPGASQLNPNVNSEKEDDETKFCSQIQRIVERAAEIVIKEQNDHRQKKISINDNIARAAVPSTQKIKLESKEFFQLQNRKLSILEEQVSNIASSATPKNRLSCISHDCVELLERHQGTTLDTTAMEIAKIQRIDASGEQSFDRQSIVDFLNSADSSSCDTSFLAEFYYPLNHGSRTHVDESSTTTTSTTYWSGTDTFTELMPRFHVQPNSAIYSHSYLDPCPVETWPEHAHQEIEPTKESLWEEEPLPRGYENIQNSCLYNGEEMINQRTDGETFIQTKNSEITADDLYSLL